MSHLSDHHLAVRDRKIELEFARFNSLLSGSVGGTTTKSKSHHGHNPWDPFGRKAKLAKEAEMKRKKRRKRTTVKRKTIGIGKKGEFSDFYKNMNLVIDDEDSEDSNQDEERRDTQQGNKMPEINRGKFIEKMREKSNENMNNEILKPRPPNKPKPKLKSKMRFLQQKQQQQQQQQQQQEEEGQQMKQHDQQDQQKRPEREIALQRIRKKIAQEKLARAQEEKLLEEIQKRNEQAAKVQPRKAEERISKKLEQDLSKEFAEINDLIERQPTSIDAMILSNLLLAPQVENEGVVAPRSKDWNPCLEERFLKIMNLD